MKYSIVLTTYNDEENIERLIKSIQKFSCPPDEIVVADGGSKDGTEDKLKELEEQTGLKMKLVFDGKRRNISEGYNTAIKTASSETILILGVGNRYGECYAEKLIEEMEHTGAEITYGPFIGIETSRFSRRFNNAFMKGNTCFDYGQASNRGALVRKRVFNKAGYFYEHFIYAGEDTEFYSRARKYNIHQVYVPEAIVYWESPSSFEEYNKKMRVNAIADMQIYSPFKLILKAGVIGCSLLLPIVGVFIEPVVSLIYCVLLILVAMIKIHRTSISDALLWLSNFYLTAYYYLIENKYMAKKYRVNLFVEK